MTFKDELRTKKTKAFEQSVYDSAYKEVDLRVKLSQAAEEGKSSWSQRINVNNVVTREFAKAVLDVYGSYGFLNGISLSYSYSPFVLVINFDWSE